MIAQFGYGYNLWEMPNILKYDLIPAIPLNIVKQRLYEFQNSDWKNTCESSFHRSVKH
jgi:hypothetical protein